MVNLIALLFTGANYYTLTRRITFFGGTIQPKVLLLISLLITLTAIILQLSSFGASKFFTIIGILGSRLFMLIPLIAILT
jgi:hypothetical protein